MSEEIVDAVYRGLIARELDPEDLSARRVASFVGKTTGALYHHFGSFDGLLFQVSQRAYIDLQAELERRFAESGEVADVAEAFVDFGLDHPELYPLMFERHYDWSALREHGAFEGALPSAQLLTAVACVLAEAGSSDAELDTRLLFAGLHGMVSLAASGRANVGALDRTDRDVARATARALAARIVPSTPPRSLSE